MKWETRPKPHFAILLMVCCVLILGLGQTLTAAAQTDPAVSPETANLLIYKNYGEDPYTSALPAACTENCDQDSTPYYKPAVNPVPYTRSDNSEVATTGMWPYTGTLKIYSHWPSGETTPCSGMLVEAQTLLTAGQCVYTHQADLCAFGDESCWVEDLEVVPAYADGEGPYGRSGYRTILTWTAWTEAENNAYDLAAVQLRYPIGAPLGWLGVGFNTDDSYFTGQSFTSTSYPLASPFNGETMAEWTGTFSTADTDLFHIPETGDSGQIGAGLYGADGIVYGILTNPNAGGEALAARITYDKFAAFREFIELGLPKDSLDLAVFDVHANPLWCFPNQQLQQLDFFVQNFSTEDLPEGTTLFDVFLSDDRIISAVDDEWLGTVTYTGALPANTGIRLSFTSAAGLSLPAVIHGDQPNGGTFYIGVIAALTDGNPDNNRAEYYQPAPIWVNDSDNTTIVFPIVMGD